MDGAVLVALMLSTLTVPCACVCYMYREPDPISGKYIWSVIPSNPCDCPEMRLGGVNARFHPQAHRVPAGGNLRLSIGKLEPEDRTLLGCSDALSTTSTLPCKIYTISPGLRFKIPGTLSPPLRVEFVVLNTVTDWVGLDFCTSINCDNEYFVSFTVQNTNVAYVGKNHAMVKQKYGINPFGSIVLITLNGGHLEVGLKGGDHESFLVYDDPAPFLASAWFIFVSNNEYADWHFYEPCS